MASLLEELDALRSENTSLEETVDDHIKVQRAADQSRIAWVIIWAFVVAVAGIFAVVVGAVVVGRSWQDPAEFLTTLVSSVLLPVVTLVLGYYFGKEKTE